MAGKTEIHEFVQGILASAGDQEPLADDESLILSGRLQSIDAVEIIAFLEEKFGIDFAEIGFEREQIDTVDAMYVLAKAHSNRN